MEHIEDDIIKDVYYIPFLEYKNEGGVKDGMTYHFYAEILLNSQCNYLKELGTVFEGIGVKRRELWKDLINTYTDTISYWLLQQDKNYKLRQSKSDCLLHSRTLADSAITKPKPSSISTTPRFGCNVVK